MSIELTFAKAQSFRFLAVHVELNQVLAIEFGNATDARPIVLVPCPIGVGEVVDAAWLILHLEDQHAFGADHEELCELLQAKE